MKLINTLFVFSFSFLLVSSLFAQTFDEAPSPIIPEEVEHLVVPPDYTATPGTSTFTGPLATTARTYQLLIHEDLLVSLVGKDLLAISWRIPTSATTNWPAADVTIANYDVYLSGSVSPNQRSLTFAENIVGTQTQVRSGSLNIAAESYRFGNTPNDFGPSIMFNSPWLYTGGHLLIEIRHSGFTGTTRSNDALSTSTAGYATLFSACWTGSYTGISGSQGNFSIVRISADDVIPVELTSFTASVSANNVNLNWATATETNNLGFEVERAVSAENLSWEVVGFVNGAGTTVEQRSYSFSDHNLAPAHYVYRLKQIDFDGTFEYSDVVFAEVTPPAVYSLEQNYPNPFNPSTTINYSIADDGLVQLSVYNLLGQEVISLVNEYKEAGSYTINMDASSLTSGAYFYKLTTPMYTQTKKMLLTK